MSELDIKEVRLETDGSSLTITSRDDPNVSLSLDNAAIDALADFVQSMSTTEANRRRAFRVPLHSCGELRTQIRIGEKLLAVTPTNISITGIFVIPRPGEPALALSQCDRVEVILELDGKQLTFDGVVVRQQGNGFGFFFPESMQGEQIHPPLELMDLVLELQRRMVARYASDSFGD